MEAGATKTSAIDFASDTRNATLDPSREKLKLDPTDPSDAPRRVTDLVSGSRRNNDANER